MIICSVKSSLDFYNSAIIYYMNNNLELLMPGGSLEKIKYAIAYGADAIYAGVPKYSLRARENEFFQIESVKEAVDFVHSNGKKIYLTCNIYAHNNKIKGFMDAMKEMVELKPDAFIMTDPGLIALTKEKFPEAVIHLSTQANNTNWAQVKFWKDYGVKRVILARELTVKEIKEIHEMVPDIELEAFIHGSICMAYSGRCLLSNYFNYRDANQGTCSNSCRWEYKLYANDAVKIDKKNPSKIEIDDVLTDYVPLVGDFYLEEETRKGQFMPVDEDEHGTYIMNSKDLCAVDYLEKLHDAGVISFKVEGRNKTEYYTSLVARAYRKGIDIIKSGKEIPDEIREWMLNEVSSTTNRGFIPGFYARNPMAEAQELSSKHALQTHLYAAKTVSYDRENNILEVEVKNRMDKGDEITFITPENEFVFKLGEMYYYGHPKSNLRNNADKEIKLTKHAHAGGENIYIEIPFQLGKNWDITIARMTYKEPITLKKRTQTINVK